VSEEQDDGRGDGDHRFGAPLQLAGAWAVAGAVVGLVAGEVTWGALIGFAAGAIFGTLRDSRGSSAASQAQGAGGRSP
jgi:hypothetical protein